MTTVIHIALLAACLVAAYLAARPRPPRDRHAADGRPDNPA